MKFNHSCRAVAIAVVLATTAMTGGCAIPAIVGDDPVSTSDTAAHPDVVVKADVAAKDDGAAKDDVRERQALADLKAGIARYEQGQYVEAIRMLQSSQLIWASSTATRATAFKYLAFSQCVSSRRKACADSFDALLMVDPTFELAASEAGHPQWGPVFRAARAKAARTATKTATKNAGL